MKQIENNMEFKTIELKNPLPDVLLFRDTDDDGNQIVTIQCYGYNKDSDEEIAFELVRFHNADACRRFIRDFSEESATEYAEEFDLVCSPNKL